MQENRPTAHVEHYVKLTEEERVQAAVEAARLDKEEIETTAEMSKVLAGFKTRLKEIAADRSVNLRLYREGTKRVMSECYAVNNYTDRIVEYKTVDTGEIVKSRKMTEEEYSLPSLAEENGSA